MPKYILKHLPYAIYFDTNLIRSAGPYLDQPWISELLSIAKESGVGLFISELVLREWCKYIIDTLQAHKSKFFASIALLAEYGIEVPKVGTEDINLPDEASLIETVKAKMNDMGFSFVENWDAPLSQLLDEAVNKMPPFEHGGKGLCDAVILESYANHAGKSVGNPRVLLISRDEAVKKSKDRFAKHGVRVVFLNEKELVIKLKSLLDDEINTYRDEKAAKLESYVRQHEEQVLERAQKTPIHLTDWFLNPPHLDEQNKTRGTINKVLSVKPSRILQVVGGTPAYGVKVPEDRYPLQIYVELEMDVVVNEYTTGALQQMMQTRAVIQPDTLDSSTPVELRSTFDLGAREIVQSIKRTMTLYATIDKKQESEGTYDDFRIEELANKPLQ